jgi:hypothetical protein
MTKPKKPKPRSHECFAVMPDGAIARRVTAHAYRAALCVPQVGKSGLWVVLRWSKSTKLLQTEARRRNSQTHGEREAVVVPVEDVKR